MTRDTGRRRRATGALESRVDVETTIRLFRALVAAARARSSSQLADALDDVRRGGPEQALPVGLLSHYVVRRAAYPDWPGGVVDMQLYIAKIREAYQSLSGFLDRDKISYNDFGKAVGSWATHDQTVDAAIAMTCQLCFLSVQWPEASDEPGDEELAREVTELMSQFNK